MVNSLKFHNFINDFIVFYAKSSVLAKRINLALLFLVRCECHALRRSTGNSRVYLKISNSMVLSEFVRILAIDLIDLKSEV